MPEQQQPAEGNQGNQQSSTSLIRTAVQSVAIFFLIQSLAKSFFGGNQQAAPSTGDSSDPVARAASTPIPAFWSHPPLNQLEGPYSPIPQNIAPIWPADTSVDVRMYVSPSLAMPSLEKVPSGTLVLDERNMKLDDWQEDREIQTSFDVPREVQQNGTLWAHLYVARTGSTIDPTAGHYDPAEAYHFARPLNHYLIKRKQAKVRNLISGGKTDDTVEDEPEIFNEKGRTVASYYHPNFTLSFIPSNSQQPYQKMHPAAREWVQLESTGARDLSGQNGWHYPILYINTFWQLRSHMTELNSTVTTLPLNIQLNNMANWKFSVISSMDYGQKVNKQKVISGETLPGGGDGSEIDEIKRILIDSNIYLLSTTVFVGILHTIFEMLAFKSDVSHWRNKKDNVGVSVRTIMANVFMQTIILLYLIDNTESTSWMIFMSQGMGILLEAWKVTKTVDVRIRPTPANATSIWKFLPYTIVFEDKHKLSETEKKTQEYDEIAFKYMYWVAIPLLGAYAAYSLIYESHKSWYSFTITTLVGSVYAYGFLLMVPSLYINYRLQSVAHMPGRAMTYKCLNTFIDDLFAFTVKMPFLHRLATLRDDVIFFIYLYQSYKYKVDFTRVNEFGQGGDDDEEPAAEGEAKAVEGKKTEKFVGDSTVDGAKGNGVKATGVESGEGAKKRK